MSVPTVAVAPLDAPVIVSAAVKSVAPNPAVKVYEIGDVVEIILPTAPELAPVIFSPLRKVPTRLLTVNCGAVAAALVSSESNTACNLNTSARPKEISLSVDLTPYAPSTSVAITLSCLDSCVVFFISPRKFNKSVKDIKDHFSGRKILICREMTKFYEEYIRVDINDLEPFKLNPKGELTIVISEKKKEKKSSIMLNESDKKKIQIMIKKLSIKDITDLISQNSNVPKKEIYNYCLKLKNEE